MRLPLLTLLLLGTASPVLADPITSVPDEQVIDRPEPRPEPERVERPLRVERESAPQPAFEPRQRRFEQQERTDRAMRDEGGRPRDVSDGPSGTSDPIRRVARERIRSGDPSAPAEVGGERRPRDGVAEWRWREREAERRSRSRDVPLAAGSPVFGEAIPGPRTATGPGRDLSVGSVAAGRVESDRLRNRIAAEGWRQDWRRDRRYDWRRHRDRDRSRFHLGFYVDPFGWNYRPWDIGWRLPHRFYASRYWIRDPWLYRLPPVYGPYRWIRYHQDVLLVDLRDGRVVDRIRSFFW